MKKLKLFPKTFLYTLCLMFVIILISHLLIYLLLPVVYNYHQKANLEKEVTVLLQNITEGKESDRLALVTDFASKWCANITVDYDGYSYEMNLLGDLSDTTHDSQGGLVDATIIAERKGNDIKISLAENLQGGADFFHIQESFADGNGSIIVFASRQQIENAVNTIVIILPFTAIICMLISTAFSLLYSRTLTKPITEISEITEQMKNLQPDTICSCGTNDEIGLLAANVNSLYQTLLQTIKELEQEVHKVEKAEIQKTDFLRAASHELKTPVTAVNVMLENMILGVGKYKDRDTYLAKCKVLTERLTSMIKEILDTSRLDTYSNQEMVDLDLADTVISVCEPFRVIAKSNGVKLNIDMSDSFHIQFAAGRLERVLSNLLSNAVSYTPRDSGIWVYANGRDLVIENECEIIPAEQLSHIFEAFYRPDYGRERKTGGNGLGLYIVASILKAAGVQYDFSPSDRIKGMAFRIRF